MTLKNTENASERSQAAVFQKVSDICSYVNVVKSARELLERSLEETMNLFDARRGSIFIKHPVRKELELEVAKGMAQDEQQKQVKRLGEGVVGRVAQLKEPIVVEDIATDSRFQDYQPRNGYKTPSFICAPLMIKDQIIGVINIADKKTGNRFNQEELQLLDFLATQIALNYRRIQLYHKHRNVVKEKKSLKDALGQSSAEAKRLKKQIVVQEKLASIGKLAGGIAHEFNNPLDGVIRYTNLCLEHLTDNDVVRGYLLEIKHGLNRMANIVKSLLACSRNTLPSLQIVELSQKIEQAITGVQPDLYHKSIQLEKKLNADVSVMDLGVELIISNLLRNAIDAVQKGGKIRISSSCSNGQIILEVEDNGCGIPPDQLDKIFEPFFTTKDIERGCGLGLTIVSEIVKEYNGNIHVESAPSKGTLFSVTLPILEDYAKRNQ